jgi:hypothetical protein
VERYFGRGVADNTARYMEYERSRISPSAL